MMCLRFARLIATCVFFAGTFAVSPGCTSSPDAKETVDSMGNFSLEIVKVKDSIDAAIKALEHVVASEPSDINANVAGYAKAYTALEKQSKVVKSRAEEMRSKGDEFFKEWEAPASVSPERRAQLTASYGQIKQEMTAAKEGFIPFLASLRDIQSYLKVDATPTGIHSMGALVTKAKENAAHVKTSIDAVLTQVNSVHGMLSTKSE